MCLIGFLGSGALSMVGIRKVQIAMSLYPDMSNQQKCCVNTILPVILLDGTASALMRYSLRGLRSHCDPRSSGDRPLVSTEGKLLRTVERVWSIREARLLGRSWTRVE